jgi:hypothetical protein
VPIAAPPPIIARAAAYVACHASIRGEQSDALLEHPKRCSFAVAHGTPRRILVRGLSWHGWGGPSTRASGTYVRRTVRRRAHATLYRTRSCLGVGRVYTRLRLAVRGRDARTVRLDHCE